MLHEQYYMEKAKVDRLVNRRNRKTDFYNGIYDRYEFPVLTREPTGNIPWPMRQKMEWWIPPESGGFRLRL